jgi:phage tail-like protein
MVENRDTELSRLMEYLPAIYQGMDDSDQPPFLSYFLLAFEKVLLGRKEHSVPKRPGKSSPSGETGSRFESLEDEVNDLHRLFEPNHTPERFLAWLAGWAALSLEASLSLERRRELVARIIPLYRIRGTKAYLEELLRLHLGAEATVAVDDDERPHLQVGRYSTIGRDCYLGGGAPHTFWVSLAFPELDWQRVEPKCRLARRVIDLAKPAHTLYELNVKSHKMQVGVHSTVGVDTVFGDEPAERAPKGD